MKLETLKLTDVFPYENNPRKNDDAVNAVAESIKQCSYIAPIIVDEGHVIIAGHTRYKALKALGIAEVPCLICDGLTEEQKNAVEITISGAGLSEDGAAVTSLSRTYAQIAGMDGGKWILTTADNNIQPNVEYTVTENNAEAKILPPSDGK